MENTSTVIDLVSAITALLLVAAAVLALSKRLHLPFTVMLVVAGIGRRSPDSALLEKIRKRGESS